MAPNFPTLCWGCLCRKNFQFPRGRDKLTNYFAIGATAFLFLSILVVFTQEKLDYVAFSLFVTIIACLITADIYHTTFTGFVEHIEWEPLFFIISMQIIILFVEKVKLFQWVAIRILHLTKGDHRKFFYLICAVSTISAAFVADLTVALIFVPLIIRACKILKIEVAPYLFGFIFTIVIGSSMSPFSSSENILIAHAFVLDIVWFSAKIMLFGLVALGLTLILVDVIFLRKIAPPADIQRQILLEIMDPSMVVIDRRNFLVNALTFVAIIVSLIFIDAAYLVAAIGALVMCFVNHSDIGENLKQIDWKIIFFFIALFLIIGDMEINGTFELISGAVASLLTKNVLLAALAVLMLTAVLSGILANVPTTLVFITLLEDTFGVGHTAPEIIYVAFLLGVNLGANLLPQGAASVLMTLNIAHKKEISDFTYKRVLVNGVLFTVVHLAMCAVYLVIMYYIL